MSDIALIKISEKRSDSGSSEEMPSSILHIDVPSTNGGYELEQINPPKMPSKEKIKDGLVDRMSAVGTQSLSSEDVSTEFGLHLAAREGAVEILRAKLEACKNEGHDILRIIDLKDMDGLAPLHHAAKANKKEAASLLLEYDAYADIAGEDCNTPLHLAAK